MKYLIYWSEVLDVSKSVLSVYAFTERSVLWLCLIRGADDLLPILTYVIIRSRLPQVVSECQAMEEFIHEG